MSYTLSLDAFIRVSNKLELNLNQEEISEIFVKFNKEVINIQDSQESVKDCAQILYSVSNKKIKINHALEIISRGVFNQNWHVFCKKENAKLNTVLILSENNPFSLNNKFYNSRLETITADEFCIFYDLNITDKDKYFLENLGNISFFGQSSPTSNNKYIFDLQNLKPTFKIIQDKNELENIIELVSKELDARRLALSKANVEDYQRYQKSTDQKMRRISIFITNVPKDLSKETMDSMKKIVFNGRLSNISIGWANSFQT